MMAIGTSSTSFKEVEKFALHLPSSVKYAKVQNDVCVEQLGIPQPVIDSAPLSRALEESRTFYAKVAQDDKWFASVGSSANCNMILKFCSTEYTLPCCLV
jgi:hypothetical protein